MTTMSNVKTKLFAATAGGSFVRLAMIALLLGAIAIAFSPIFVRLSQVGPTATGFWRLTLALPALWLWLAFEQRSVDRSQRAMSRTDVFWLVAAGLCFAGDLATWHLSIKFTTVANAVFLANLASVFVTVGGWLLFRQRVSRAFVGGMLLALSGAAMLIGVSFTLSLRHLLGDMLGLTTAVFYGGYFLCVKRLRGHISTATVMTWSGAVAAIVLLPLTLLSGEVLLATTTWGWLVLLGLALFSHAGGQGLIAYTLAHLPATFTSVSLLIQPVLSALFAWIILNEALGPWQAMGGLIVLAGIFVARRGSRLG